MTNYVWLLDNFFHVNNENINTSNEPDFLHSIARHNFTEIIFSQKSNEILKDFTNNLPELQGAIIGIEKSIEKYILDQPNKKSVEDVLCLGIASLQHFVQLNWTGPDIEGEVGSWLGGIDGGKFVSELTIDAEEMCPVAQGHQWLALARAILVKSRHLFAKYLDLYVVLLWWGIRCLSVHQSVLEEASVQLHSELALLQSQIATSMPWLGEEQIQSQKNDTQELTELEENSKVFPELEDYLMCQVRALFWIELAKFRLQYSEVNKSRKCLEEALKAIGLEASLIGALGKRTRFQAHDLPQLALRVTTSSNRSSENTSTKQINEEDLPRDIKLNDEVRLPQVSFTSEKDGEFPSLTPVEQAVLLACYGHILKSQPKDSFAEEELLPYLNCILAKPQSWSLQLSALLARCKLEAFHRRTVERSMTQAQLLVDCINKDKPDAAKRLGFIHASQMSPRWKVEAELASLFISLGAVNSALDIFVRLHMWEDVIACYHLLELRHKAAEVVRQELDHKPSPKLWCMLGDATDDISCYETAWELSNHRSAMAQRHLGFHYFSRKENEKCIPYLEKSLELNSLQPLVLSRLAYAYLDLEDWTNCARTYRQLCTLGEESFESWNNLAKAYVKLGEKARAWKVLQEALKCNFENWQVWDNLMVVSIDCAEYQEAIRAYHRLLDLRGSHVDNEVLDILVKSITLNLPENRGQNAGRLLKKGLELFGRLTSIVTNDAKVWQLYAQLSGNEPNTPQTTEKVVQFLQRAQRCATQAPNWYREIGSCKDAANIMISLANTCLELSKQSTSPANGIKIIASPRLAINSFLSKVKAQHVDPVTGKLPDELEDCVAQLATKMEELVQLNKSLTATANS